MKKFLCVVLAAAMTIGMATSAFASSGGTQAITFNEDGTGTVTIKDNATTTDTTNASNQEQQTDSNVGNILESVFGTSTDSNSKNGQVKGYLALGQNLSSTQLATVLALLGVASDDLGSYDVVYTTNAEEHQYLDKYISPSVIGKNSLSSVLVTPAEAGHGVVVTTENINYCTVNMYRNALITAGVTDADIKVVGPSPISGTAALIGALKAYEKMSGKAVSTKALDTSLNELVTTGEIKESVGSDAQAEEFISYIKTVIATNDLETEEEIDAAIRKAMVDLNVSLTEDEIKQIKTLMIKIKAMGIDYSVLVEQADDIYAKYKVDIDAGTFDLSKIDLNDAGIKDILSKALNDTLSNIGGSIKTFFGKLFSR